MVKQIPNVCFAKKEQKCKEEVEKKVEEKGRRKTPVTEHMKNKCPITGVFYM